MTRLIRPVNWNHLEDPYDLEIWNTLNKNLWLDTKIAISNDLQSWHRMTEDERTLVKRVFTGLTALDTIQAEVGADSLKQDALTPHEVHNYNQIAYMESVHAKSYSTIFSTLCSTEEITEVYDWAENDEHLINKEQIVLSYYDGDDPLKRKIASTLLESFLFYSGFFTPLYFSTRSKLTNTADIIRLIIRDESIHGMYIGYKYQQAVKRLSEEERAHYYEFTITLLMELYMNEVKYTENLYDTLGLTGEVKKFLRYNANKALSNLGYDPLFPAKDTQVMPEILTSLAPSSENHDFFSGSGSSYVQAKVEDMQDDDWEF